MEWGAGGRRVHGPLWALPLRAFFCSFSVSEDFFLISCRARLYSAHGVREECGDAAGEGAVCVCAQRGQEALAPAQDLPFAWSLSSWLADFFQSSMRSCSGLMRLSSSALWEAREGQGHQWVLPAPPPARPPARGAHSLGELPQLGLDAAVAHAHARERRPNVPGGPW